MLLGFAAHGCTDDQRHDDAGREDADSDVQVTIGELFLGYLLFGVLSSLSLGGDMPEQGGRFRRDHDERKHGKGGEGESFHGV